METNQFYPFGYLQVDNYGFPLNKGLSGWFCGVSAVRRGVSGCCGLGLCCD